MNEPNTSLSHAHNHTSAKGLSAMILRTAVRVAAPAVLATTCLALAACSSDSDTPSGSGNGSASFNIYGEDFIEKGIPADAAEGGFVDGWSVKFDRFLVTLKSVSVADPAKGVGGSLDQAQLFNLVKPGPHAVGSIAQLEARSWSEISYELAPAMGSRLAPSATAEDQTTMSAGYAIYAEGTGTKGAVSKRFKWGFTAGTRYNECTEVDDSGKTVRVGIVVGNGTTENVQLTIHGDHLFYDSLGEDAVLRFDPIAQADADNDGEVTLTELAAVRLATIDVGTPQPRYIANEANLQLFINRLIQNLGHFRGEGHCLPKSL